MQIEEQIQNRLTCQTYWAQACHELTVGELSRSMQLVEAAIKLAHHIFQSTALLEDKILVIRCHELKGQIAEAMHGDASKKDYLQEAVQEQKKVLRIWREVMQNKPTFEQKQQYLNSFSRFFQLQKVLLKGEITDLDAEQIHRFALEVYYSTGQVTDWHHVILSYICLGEEKLLQKKDALAKDCYKKAAIQLEKLYFRLMKAEYETLLIMVYQTLVTLTTEHGTNAEKQKWQNKLYHIINYN